MSSFTEEQANTLATNAKNDALGKQPGSSSCSNGGQGNGQATSRGNGPAKGVYNGIKGSVGKDLQPGLDQWNAAHADTGLKAYAFSGVGSRSVGTSKHPSGNAVDVVIVDKNGCALNNLWNGDTPSYRAYESLAATVCQTSGGQIGWGGNFGGDYFHDTMHFQNGGPVGQRGRVCEGKANPYIPNNSDPTNTRYDGPTTCQEANGGQGEARGGQPGQGNDSGCAEQGGGGGCQPSGAGIGAAASSMMSGLGMAGNGILGAALGAIGGNPLGALQGLVQQGLGGVLNQGLGGLLQNGAGSLLGGNGLTSLLPGGLSNPLTQLTSQIGGLVQNLGGSILPSLTGVIPSLLAGGNLSGLMTGVIQNQLGSLIGAGMPNLGGFGQVLNSAIGAAASGADLKNVLLGSVSQGFGNIAQGALGNANIPGFNITDKLAGLGLTNVDDIEGIADNLNLFQTSLKPLDNQTVDFTGPFNDTLTKLIDNPEFNGFSSMFYDYNSMITHGFGELTNNMTALGYDFANLGQMGDLNDLLNVGTPGQLVRQIIEKGLGATTGISDALVASGLSISDLKNEENSQELFSILDSINDKDTIDKVKKRFAINSNLQIEKLGDLLNPEIIFPNSYKSNTFNELRDIALTLSVAGGPGNLKNLGDLGYMLASLENAEKYTELLQEKQPLRISEYVDINANLPVESWFGKNGPTVADFIGTIGGYVHNDSLPEINTLLQELHDDPITDDFYDSMTVLANTLSNPNVVNILGVDYVVVPGYGNYTTLDAAVTDIVNEVENNLLAIKTAAESDPELDKKLSRLEELHYMSSSFLAHEYKMRKKYNVDFGDPEKIDNYNGDGVSQTFPIYPSENSYIQVFVDGSRKIKDFDFTYNKEANTVTLNSAPAVGKKVSIHYQANTLKVESRSTDIWQLARNLETLALETGHGSPADFISRVVTDDYHGQRIMATMMQSRNNTRLNNFGMNVPSFNSILTDGSDINKNVNFITHTGIWSNDPSRAAEIWIQNAENVASIDDYVLQKFSNNKDEIQEDLDLFVRNITRQLLFYNSGNLVMSELLVSIYQDNAENDIYQTITDSLLMGWSDELPYEGYKLGPYKEILSSMSDIENLKNNVFSMPLSDNTTNYLKKINVDLRVLITVCQRVLLINSGLYLGISESDFRSIFGVQSITKAILKNIASDY